MPQHRYKLSDLRLFLAVVDAGSVSGGAKHVFLALSSVSERLSQLETALGMPLLKRVRRGVAPTSAGQVVAEHARRCFAGLERMHVDLANYSDNVRTTISLAVNSTSLIKIVPDALESFFRDHPLVDVLLTEARSADVVADVAAGRVDIGLTSSDRHPALSFEPLYRDELAVITAPTHPMATAARVDFGTCLEQSLIGLRAEAPLHQLIVDQAKRLGRPVSYRVLVNNLIAIGNLVAAGVGIAIVPRSLVDQLDDRLACLRLAESWALRHINICTPANPEVVTPHLANLITHLRAAVA